MDRENSRTRKCRLPKPCIYFSGGTCEFLFFTGRARSLICPAGDGCTEKVVEGGRVRRVGLDPDQEKAALKLYDQGFSDPVIARSLHSTRPIVRNWRLRNNLPANVGGGRPKKTKRKEANYGK